MKSFLLIFLAAAVANAAAPPNTICACPEGFRVSLTVRTGLP